MLDLINKYLKHSGCHMSTVVAQTKPCNIYVILFKKGFFSYRIFLFEKSLVSVESMSSSICHTNIYKPLRFFVEVKYLYSLQMKYNKVTFIFLLVTLLAFHMQRAHGNLQCEKGKIMSVVFKNITFWQCWQKVFTSLF